MLWRWMTSDNLREPKQKFRFKADAVHNRPLPTKGLKVMWLSHSTLLIEIDGKRFLTDPVWSKRCSPFSFMGPARFFDMPLDLGHLPKLDGVIISHDHYDHLDYVTVMQLKKSGVPFYCPLGVGSRLLEWGVAASQIQEFDWWDEIPLGRTHLLTATPARYFPGRGMFDRNKTLWASWVIQGPQHNVFYGGDSGYFSGFPRIGRKYGPFDLTFLEVGAYDKNWESIHMGPENAVQAHSELRGNILFPIHWGTFNLAIHAWTDPAERVLSAAQEKQVLLALPKPGQMLNLAELPLNSYWWRT